MAQTIDAKQYYGYLFEVDKKPTKVLDALLRGIAIYISTSIGHKEQQMLTPDKLAAFYRAVGGNYDSLFIEVPYPSISWIYASIGCQHTLQPATDDFAPPSIPALTTKGFVRWQATEILLGPEEHVPLIQTAVRTFRIKNPDNGEPFPIDLPTEAFPLKPDKDIEKWHSACAEKLRQRATPTDEVIRPRLPPGSRIQSGYTHVRPLHREETDNPYSYNHNPKSRSSRSLSYQHASGRRLRPKLSRSPTARQFLESEDSSPLRSRRRSVPDNVGFSSVTPPQQGPDLKHQKQHHFRSHSHPRHARRGSFSSDASSSSDGESPSSPWARGAPLSLHDFPHSSVRSAVPPSPSVQAVPPPVGPRLRTKDRKEELKRRDFSIPIDLSGKLSAPFLLGRRFPSEVKERMTLPIPADDLSLHLREVKLLIAAIAAAICRGVTDTAILEDVRVKRISNALPRLLKEFSQELVGLSKPGTQQDAAKFVQQYREHIAISFCEAYASLRSRLADATGDQQATTEEKIAGWSFEPADAMRAMTTYSEHLKDFEQDLVLDDNGNSEVENKLADLTEAIVLLLQNNAFKQLQLRIRNESWLSGRDGQAIQFIRTAILGILDALDLSFRASSRVPNLRTAKFSVSWNPVEFLQQQYPEVERPVIKDIITLTGTATDAQAVTCEDYIRQLWPLSGQDALHVLQMVVNDPGQAHERALTDGTILELCLNRNILSVTVTGTILKIADIGEQFAWLGAACRTSHKGESLAFSIVDLEPSTQQSGLFSVKYKIQDPRDSEISHNGACWHQLFKNPVIVAGFPILARDQNERGLEIPLEMMARLGGAERATIYDGQLVIKGFSAIFVPTEQRQNSIMWHFLFNKNEERISYIDAKQRCSAKVLITSYSCLESSRNFLGWSTSVLLYTGSKDMDYRMLRFTGSNLAGPGCVLEKITLSAGKFITVGGTFAVGNKDTNLTILGLRPYERQIHEASRINVILYDVDDHRAWLVDGANALLHMTRATLSQDEFLDNPFLDIKEFPYADPKHGNNAAIRALKQIGVKNPILIRDTPMFSQSSSGELNWGVKELVQAHWHILEQIQDYQTTQSGPGIPLRLNDRDKLEGFGFVDIASGEPNIRPRVAILNSSGRGLVDFARKIRAITLMARGFGEIMKPSKTSQQLCHNWNHVPKGQDYLVARICQLRQICEKFGSIREKSLELVQDLYWHQGRMLFEPCKTYTCSPACDRVQTLLSEHTLGPKNCPAPFDELEGAVIFGRCNMSWRWWPKNQKLGAVGGGPVDDRVVKDRVVGDGVTCTAEDGDRQSTDVLVALFSDSAIGSEDPGALDLMSNQPRAGSVDNTNIVDVGTGVKGKEPAGRGIQFNRDIEGSRVDPSTFPLPSTHDLQAGTQFDTGSDVDSCDDSHPLDLTISPSMLISQLSGVDARPRRAESLSKRVRKRQGISQLRAGSDCS